jgi:hypothetical protein
MLAWLLDQLGALVVYGGAGLLIGWNVLPQPEFVKKNYDKAVAWVKEQLD